MNRQQRGAILLDARDPMTEFRRAISKVNLEHLGLFPRALEDEYVVHQEPSPDSTENDL